MTNRRTTNGRTTNGRGGVRYTADDVYDWFNHGVDRRKRTIYIGAGSYDSEGKNIGVDALCAEWAVKGLHLLNNSRRKAYAILDSIGGDWYHGMAIFDAIRGMRCPIDVIGTGNIMSMGAVLLQAPKGERRLLTPNATVMVHHGYADHGNLKHGDAQRWAAYEEKMAKKMADILAERSEKNAKYWHERCKEDSIFTAEEAIDIGLADRIVDYNAASANGRRTGNSNGSNRRSSSISRRKRRS